MPHVHMLLVSRMITYIQSRPWIQRFVWFVWRTRRYMQIGNQKSNARVLKGPVTYTLGSYIHMRWDEGGGGQIMSFEWGQLQRYTLFHCREVYIIISKFSWSGFKHVNVEMVTISVPCICCTLQVKEPFMTLALAYRGDNSLMFCACAF